MPYDFLPPPLKPVYIDILSPLLPPPPLPEGRLIGGRGKVMDPDKASIDRCVERERRDVGHLVK